MLGDLGLVDGLADEHANDVLAGQPGGGGDARLDLFKALLGGAQQSLKLVGASFGQRCIAARHQAFAGIVRHTELEQITLIKQAKWQVTCSISARIETLLSAVIH